MLWTEFPNPIFGNKTKKKKGRKEANKATSKEWK